jgi:hypothetical protein
MAEAHELFFRGLGQEFAPAPFAHDDVNASYQLLGNDNMSAFCVHDSSPPGNSKSHLKFNKKWEYVNGRLGFWAVTGSNAHAVTHVAARWDQAEA